MLKGKIQSAHPVHYVADIERSRRFYCDLLGLDLAFEIPEAKLLAVEFTETALLVLSENPAKVIAHPATFVLNIDDVDAAYSALQSKGHKLPLPPSDEFYGRALDLLDPDNYPLCLVSQYPE